MVGNCEVLESINGSSVYRKDRWCPVAEIIISSSVFRDIWGQTKADPFRESLIFGLFFFLDNLWSTTLFSYSIYRCFNL